MKMLNLKIDGTTGFSVCMEDPFAGDLPYTFVGKFLIEPSGVVVASGMSFSLPDGDNFESRLRTAFERFDVTDEVSIELIERKNGRMLNVRAGGQPIHVPDLPPDEVSTLILQWTGRTEGGALIDAVWLRGNVDTSKYEDFMNIGEFGLGGRFTMEVAEL